MRAGTTIHDIKLGTLFRFNPGQYLELYVNDTEQFHYLYRSSYRSISPALYDEKIIAYMGLKRIRETLLPNVKAGKHRSNFFVLRPIFIMDGKLVFVDSFDMLYPFAGQDDVYENNN